MWCVAARSLSLAKRSWRSIGVDWIFTLNVVWPMASGAIQQLKTRSTMALRKCVMSFSLRTLVCRVGAPVLVEPFDSALRDLRMNRAAVQFMLATRLLIWQYMLQILRMAFLRGVR